MSVSAINRWVLDRVFPPVCLACDAPISDTQNLCAACWGQLELISAPFCPVLGLPFAMDLGPDAKSAEALANPPIFDRARYGVRFNDKARDIVHQLKYHDRFEMADFCARLMVAGSAEFWQQPGLIVPVPLHWRRQFSRRYNQSTLLAERIAQRTGFPLERHLVKRIKSTRQQVGLKASARAQNVRGAFALDAVRMSARPTDRIILVDDVMTTGATITALAKLLRSHYIKHIDVLCFARVTHDPLGASEPL